MIKKHHLNLYNFLLVYVLTFICSNATALLSSKYSWVKIKSPHFTILVDKNHKKYGGQVARKAEQAFHRLQNFSKKHPKNTFIIVDHTKGYSNGSATFFPYPIITLQPVTPSASSSVGQYNDWLLELLIHEYTHILSFHNTKGLFTPLRWVLGNTVSPGYFLPTWYQEGIAVFTESHLSNGGRLRSSAYQAFKKKLKASNISLANEQGLNIYPRGASSYVYGGWLNQDLLGEKGISGAAKIHKTFSGRLPYTVNGAYKRTAKKSAYQSWRQLFGSKKRIKQNSKSRTKPGLQPYWDEESKRFFYIKLDSYGSHQVIVSEKDKKDKVLFSKSSILKFKVFKDKLYYLKLNNIQQDHQFYSLFVFDMEKETHHKFKFTKLENSKHSNNPQNIKDFDILEDNVLLSTATLNQQVLYKTELPKELKERIKVNKPLLVEDGETRLSFPFFISKDKIAYCKKTPGKKEEIIIMSLKSKKSKTALSAEHIIDIKKNNSGAFALYENQGLKHLENLRTREKVPVEQGMQNFTIKNKDTLVSSQITQKGLFIFEEPLSKNNPNKIKQAVLQIPEYKSTTNFNAPKTTETRYSSFQKLRPHYIIPSATVSPYGFSGEFSYGVSTGGQDPLGLHSYSLSATTDSITNELSYAFNYTSRHFRLPVQLDAGVFTQPLSLNFFRKSTFATLGTSYALRSSFARGLNFRFNTIWNSTEVLSGGANSIKRLGASLDLGYNRSRLRPRELAPVKGFSINSGVRHYLAQTGFFNYTQSYIGLRKFLRSPLHKTHRIVFGADGQINDRSLRILFSTSSQNQPYRNVGPGGFALRGLPTGGIFAQESFLVGHIDYRFPILNINWGPGLLPGFFKRITGALTVDYGSAEGQNFLAQSEDQQMLTHSTPLYSAGGELVFEGSVFYHVPASLQIGVYKFLNSSVYSSSPEIFVGFGLSGLPF